MAGNASSCACSAISIGGEISEVPCKEYLPVLCSQTAPTSSPGAEDPSPEFQITQRVGDVALTGYRDFFTWKFLGVRYAPTPKRFEYSEPLRGASGAATALKAGFHCLQPLLEVSGNTSDDCLFANIWTPFLPHGGDKVGKLVTLKPVFVFFHGGGFQTGTAANPNTDGTNLASRADVVVVAINYRVSNAGMLVFNDGIHNGNTALSDQVSALKWVSENIAAFGGDPDRVTIGGDSAGAMATRYMMTSPEARGLFKQANLRSDGQGSVLYNFGHFMSIEQSYEMFTVPLLAATGCDDAQDAIACLREVDGADFQDILGTQWPVVDGTYLTTPHTPLNGTNPGYAQDVAVMSSITAEEGGVYLTKERIGVDLKTVSSLEQWSAELAAIGVDVSPALENPEIFGLDLEGWTTQQLISVTERILSLGMFSCLDKAQMYSAALHGSFKIVYGHLYNRTYSVPTFTNEYCEAPAGGPTEKYMRCHGADQLLVFGNILRVGLPDRDGLDTPFSRLVMDYLASFLWTGNPNPDQEYLALRGYESTLASVRETEEWTPVDPENPEWLVLKPGGVSMEGWGAEEAMCAALGMPLNYWEA